MEHGIYVEAEPIIDKFLEKGINFYYLCGGRGIGKTYGALDLCRKIGEGTKKILGEEGKFMYLRRTAVEAQSISSPEACPFKRYNKNELVNIYADFNAKLGFGDFYMERETGDIHIGYCAALSTFANLRGVDFSDVTFILYDECIPESRNKAPLRNEGLLFLNMLESINRNRALEGLPEVVVLMLSNPIDLGNPLLTDLDFTPIITRMIFKGQQRYTDHSRSLHIEVLKDHTVSKLKGEKSKLYKFSRGTGFNERSLSGDFIDNDLSIIKNVPLSEYVPIYTIENLCVYEHKDGDSLHISQAIQPCKLRFKASDKEAIRATVYWKYKLALINSAVTYDTYATKVIFDNLVGYKQ